MSKRVRILVAPTCVSVMLSAVVPVFAKNDQETLGVQLAMEYLLSQDASDNVKVSFRMDGTAESTEELTAIGEKLADRISQVLLKEGKESYQSSQYPYTESGFWLNYWYDESLGSCIGCVLDPTLYNFKSKYHFPCFCVFFTLFSQLMQILLYVFTRLAFLSHLRHCKYHYYGMFILSVFVAKVLCLVKITFSVSHLTFHDCNSSIDMMPFPLCVTVE